MPKVTTGRASRGHPARHDPVQTGCPRHVNRITRTNSQVSFQALLNGLLQTGAGPPPPYEEIFKYEYTDAGTEPTGVPRASQRYCSEYPFFYNRDVAWLPSFGVALYVTEKKEDGNSSAFHLDRYLVGGICELFWRSKEHTIHYVGRHQLLEGVFPFSERELVSVLAELKGATRLQAKRRRTVNHEFVVLKYLGHTDGFVEPLTDGNYMSLCGVPPSRSRAPLA